MKSEIIRAEELAGGELQLAILAEVTQWSVRNWKRLGRVPPTAARCIALQIDGIDAAELAKSDPEVLDSARSRRRDAEK